MKELLDGYWELVCYMVVDVLNASLLRCVDHDKGFRCWALLYLHLIIPKYIKRVEPKRVSIFGDFEILVYISKRVLFLRYIRPIRSCLIIYELSKHHG